MAVLLLLVSFIFWELPTSKGTGFPFESCANFRSTNQGSCTVIQRDGAIGAESVNTVVIQGGYIDYGSRSGCPYKNNSCPNGFSYYGWMKFKAYPKSCDDFGVVVSTEVFNIHILGNGHLAVYAWLPNGTEYYAESVEPVMLDIYYPVIVQFQYLKNESMWLLFVVVQSQLIAGNIFGRPRTYTPPSSKVVFGGNGVASPSHSAYVQLDRTTLDKKIQRLDYMYQVLIDIFARRKYCNSKKGVLTQALSCYYMGTNKLDWSSAYSACSSYAYTAGYPYGRLAMFPSWNASVWNSLTDMLADGGNGSSRGYSAWIGGGRKLQWLNAAMISTGIAAVVPSGVSSSTSTSTSNSCLQVNTKTAPWQWSETSCDTAQKYVCQMSWDCLLLNPCKNLGVCQPINDGDNICKCWPGTSGRFCENGFPTVNCINNCPCTNPLISSGLLPNSTLNQMLKQAQNLVLTSNLDTMPLVNDYEVDDDSNTLF